MTNLVIVNSSSSSVTFGGCCFFATNGSMNSGDLISADSDDKLLEFARTVGKPSGDELTSWRSSLTDWSEVWRRLEKESTLVNSVRINLLRSGGAREQSVCCT